MFTGIVRTVGSIVATSRAGGSIELTVGTGGIATGNWRAGDSLCVAGVCLTATRIAEGRFCATVSRETLQCTTLGSLAPGAAVNLEPALAAGDPLGGHHVTGHVDGVARVSGRHEDAGSLQLSLVAPTSLARYLAVKGSVTLDGVSLTVIAANGPEFEVNLVPHTRAVTTLGRLAAGDAVNLEIDILARYLERLLDARDAR